MNKRVFLIVLDSFGIGQAIDAEAFNDEGSNTLNSIRTNENFYAPNLCKLGLFDIDGVGKSICDKSVIDSGEVIGNYARLQEQSKGKDTTIGHWEIAGVVTNEPFPTYPEGFPSEIIEEFSRRTGRGVLCNKAYSGTDVIRDYGEKHIKTGDLIVYTSADSVFQIASHEDIVPIDELYRYCEIAREILVGQNAVARVIARPFTGSYPNFVRTANRRDFSLTPQQNMLDLLMDKGLATIAVGKIYDIFNARGIGEHYHTGSNIAGEDKTIELMDKDFEGLCFVNLVDFDMLYGHRNDVTGYAKAINEFDTKLGIMLDKMRLNDILIITADHGCDPSTPSTDHSRENVPMLVFGKNITTGKNLGVRTTFSDIAKTILDYFDIDNELSGTSFLGDITL